MSVAAEALRSSATGFHDVLPKKNRHIAAATQRLEPNAATSGAKDGQRRQRIVAQTAAGRMRLAVTLILLRGGPEHAQEDPLRPAESSVQGPRMRERAT